MKTSQITRPAAVGQQQTPEHSAKQLRQKKATSNEMASTLGRYVKRWQRWAAAGLQDFTDVFI